MANVLDLAQRARANDALGTMTKKQINTDVSTGIPVERAFLAGDALALALAFVVGGVMSWCLRRFWDDASLGSYLWSVTPEQFLIFFGVGACSLLWLDAKGHYQRRLPFWETVGHFLKVATMGLLIGGFIQFAMKNIYSRAWLGMSWMFFPVCLYMGRSVVRSLLRSMGKWEIPAMIVGDGPAAREVRRALLSEPEMGYKVVSSVTSPMIAPLRKVGLWSYFLKQHGARFVFLALEGGENEKFQESLKSMARERLPYAMVPSWMGLPLSGLSVHHFVMRDVMLMTATDPLSAFLPRLMKRSFDVVVSSLALVMASPLFLVMAFLVRRDGGPAFYSQPRVGRYGRHFSCLKFRSMRIDADAYLEKYLARNPDEADYWARYQKLEKDPRVTRVGAFIRKTSIDELPQLINVLKGDMSLVGPRPFMPGQESFYGEDYVSYTSVRPGITGPWQVSGRSQLTFERRVALEAWYTRNWTLWLDVVIILKTIPALLNRDTAY